MAKSKTIKEVEVKFTPAFEKAINGETPIKKTKKVKPATKKVKAKTSKVTKTGKVKARATATSKPARGRAKSKYPRGYNITTVDRELTLNGEKDLYTLYELSGKKMDKTRYFVDEESAVRYINSMEVGVTMTKALSVAGYQHVKGVISAHKDMLAATELPEINTELPEKCDATSIEDIDA